MNKAPNTILDVNISAEPTGFVPSQEQINMLARRLMPEIKKFFADDQVQKEFAEWKERQNADK